MLKYLLNRLESVNEMLYLLNNVSVFLLVTIMSIAIIQIDIFGIFGLVVYGLLIAYGIFFIAVNYKKLNLLKHPIVYIAFAYYLYFIFAGIVNGNVTYTGPSLIQFFILTIVSFSVRPVSDIKKEFGILAKYLTVMGLVVSVGSIAVCLITYYMPDFVLALPETVKNKFYDFTSAFPVRATGIIGNANRSAGYIYICALFSLYLIVSNRKSKWVILGIINILIAFYSTFIIFAARTYMLCLLITFPCFFIAYLINKYRSKIFKQKIFYIIIGIVLITILCFVLACVISEDARDYILNHIVRISSLSDGSGRLGIYKASLELSKEHKVFGYHYKELHNSIGFDHAHNIFIEILASGGIPSLVLFCLFMFYTIYVAIRNVFIKSNISNETRLLICLLISYLAGYLITGMTGSDINRMVFTTVVLPSVMCSTHIISQQINNSTKWNK